jgi:hypothetical protein
MKLYTDLATYQSYKKKEDELIKHFDKLEAVAVASVGDGVIKDYKLFYANPYEYLVDEFYDLYASLYPKHLSKELVFENATKVSKEELENHKRNMERIKATMSKFAPEVTKNGLKINLKESDFDKYLNPEKEAEYKAIISFIKASEKLAKYGCSGSNYLMNFSNGKLLSKGLKVVPNNSLYI